MHLGGLPFHDEGAKSSTPRIDFGSDCVDSLTRTSVNMRHEINNLRSSHNSSSSPSADLWVLPCIEIVEGGTIAVLKYQHVFTIEALSERWKQVPRARAQNDKNDRYRPMEH